MTDTNTMMEIMAATEKRRAERRTFLKYAGGATAAVGGLSLLAACGDDNNPTPTPTPTPTATATTAQVDIDVLNFALNLEYLEASFYSFAVYGTGLSSASISGTGTVGTVTGGRAVTFTDPIVAAYAREIAADEVAHVNFLRSALGSAAVSLPSINIDGSTSSGAFSQAALAAKIIGPGSPNPNATTFDPYASDESFLLGAFIFEDVGVSAYKGAAPLLVNKTYTEAAAGILAVEAYHAGLIRTVLYRKGLTVPALVTYANKISDVRDAVDGSSDDDQGITNADGSANIVPTDSNSIVFGRTTSQVLHIVYLNAAISSSGGFFPNGLNGNIVASTANT
ncbi:ferritin-like domain-containing protein [Sphingomonas sp. CROZ-RG-20F-R02-07]|uniref:ferritin-like domain-containing protein n=1 Tax=Sphingomonas sp. CROZ-RG-20F-R02-07 TaxID=2914832 RepID=UPI001F578742|nr:ferritin-like domain-containing protein [Sphingomonas sp. CROZ-RG-20F-R02-07]